MRFRSLTLCCVAAALTATACTGHPSASPPVNTHAATATSVPAPSAPSMPTASGGAGQTLPPLVPSYPPGPLTCGSYDISATTRSGTRPLLSCVGLAGMSADQTRIDVSAGQRILISGLQPDSYLTVTPAGVLDLRGSTLVALRPGSATVIAHHVRCLARPASTLTSCPLAYIDVS